MHAPVRRLPRARPPLAPVAAPTAAVARRSVARAFAGLLGVLTALAALGLVGCGGMMDEAAYPEAPLPDPRVAPQAPPAEQVPQPAQAAQIEAAQPEEVAVGPVPEAYPEPAGGGGDGVVGGDNDTYRETDPSALTEFRTTLDPYGAWVDDETYGTVWVPAAHVVGPDFTPYVTAGHWTYEDGYVWASDYSWGWAPFHYGRWVYVGGRGWAWIPGRVYSGAWVVWRAGPVGFGYVGWGPAPPMWTWRGGYAYGFRGGYRTPYYFCENRHVFHPQVSGRVVRGPLAGDIGRRTEPYVPAQPRVGDRVAANPGVVPGGPGGPGGRVGAAPTTTPTGLRRGAAGPTLSHLALDPAKAPRPAPTDRSVRAFDFASPRTAVALGARPPSVAPRPVGALGGSGVSAAQGPARIGPPAAAMPPQRDPRAAPTHIQPGPTRLPPLRAEPRYAPAAPFAAAPYRGSPRSAPLVEHHRDPATSSPAFSSRAAPTTARPAATSRPSSSPSFSSRPSSSPSFSSRPSSSPSFSSRPSTSSPSFSPSRVAPTSPPRSSPGRVRR
ncbi:MAG: hypothetical protein IPQ09_20510 [Myxococcales bacterium]|nr:hypothetical protein [Myxococcales bacterium]